MRNLKKVFFLLISFNVFGQQPIAIQLTEKEGLPDIEFYGVVEDSKGFIWLAANKGLYRYNGKKFKNYLAPKKRGLSVFGLKFDPKKRLWCNNISGQYFYVENDSLKLFADFKKYTKGQLADFLFFNNKLYIYNSFNTLEVNLKTKKVTKIIKDSSFNIAAFKNKDTLLFLDKTNLKYITKKNTKLKQYCKLTNIGKARVKNNFYPIKNNIFLYSLNKLNRKQRYFLKNNKKFKELFFRNNNKEALITSVFSEDNLIWFCTEKGIYRYYYIKDNFVLKDTLLKDNIITGVLKDKNSNYWVTTLRNGVFILPNINITQYALPITNNNISSLEKINDSCFIYGTIKGEVVLINDFNKTKKKVMLYSEKVNKIAYNGVDKVFVSYDRKGVVLNSVNLKPLNKKPDFFLRNAKSITTVNKDKLLFGSYASVDLLNHKTNKRRRLGQRRSYTTHYNKNTQKMYAGYVDGVEYYNKDLKPYKIKFNEEPIFAIDIDNTIDNTVWFSTFSDGVIGVRNGKVICNYTTKNGLLSNQTGKIKADGLFLWIVTDKGLQRLNTKTKKLQSLTQKDGITSFNISDIAVFEDYIVFGSNKGLFRINKNQIFKKNNLPDIYN